MGCLDKRILALVQKSLVLPMSPVKSWACQTSVHTCPHTIHPTPVAFKRTNTTFKTDSEVGFNWSHHWNWFTFILDFSLTRRTAAPKFWWDLCPLHQWPRQWWHDGQWWGYGRNSGDGRFFAWYCRLIGWICIHTVHYISCQLYNGNIAFPFTMQQCEYNVNSWQLLWQACIASFWPIRSKSSQCMSKSLQARYL